MLILHRDYYLCLAVLDIVEEGEDEEDNAVEDNRDGREEAHHAMEVDHHQDAMEDVLDSMMEEVHDHQDPVDHDTTDVNIDNDDRDSYQEEEVLYLVTTTVVDHHTVVDTVSTKEVDHDCCYADHTAAVAVVDRIAPYCQYQYQPDHSHQLFVVVDPTCTRFYR